MAAQSSKKITEWILEEISERIDMIGIGIVLLVKSSLGTTISCLRIDMMIKPDEGRF